MSVLLQQLPGDAVCCGTKAAQVSQAEAKFLNPFESGIHTADGEVAAVMQHIDSWLRMTPAEQLGCVNTVMGRVLVADSMPGEISHGHSLAAMIAYYVKIGLIVTSANTAQIPREALAPRAQAVVDTAARSRRGWLQHGKETAREWSGPAVKLTARPS